MRSVKGELETPDSSRNDGSLEESGSSIVWKKVGTVERNIYVIGSRKSFMTNI